MLSLNLAEDPWAYNLAQSLTSQDPWLIKLDTFKGQSRRGQALWGIGSRVQLEATSCFAEFPELQSHCTGNLFHPSLACSAAAVEISYPQLNCDLQQPFTTCGDAARRLKVSTMLNADLHLRCCFEKLRSCYLLAQPPHALKVTQHAQSCQELKTMQRESVR